MKQVTIYLGSKCNLSCPYCHRVERLDEGPITDEFIEWLKNSNIDTVKFMGGEPTLYMSEIKKVVEALPKASFIVATNGFNLKEHLDYFRAHDFLICISFDGDKELTRGFDPFMDLLDYPKLAVSTTIYHGNTDFKAILARFAEKEKVIGRHLSFFPHFAHVTSEKNKGYALTKEDAIEIIFQYKTMVDKYMHDLYKYGIRNLRYEGLFTGLLRRYKANYEYGETYCYNKSLIKTNEKGEHYSCLYIRDKQLRDWQNEQKALLDENFPDCKTCPVYFMCGGGCIKSQTHDIECYINKTIFTWFKAEYEKWEAQYAAR